MQSWLRLKREVCNHDNSQQLWIKRTILAFMHFFIVELIFYEKEQKYQFIQFKIIKYHKLVALADKIIKNIQNQIKSCSTLNLKLNS